MGMAGYDVMTPDTLNAGSSINWLLVGIIVGGFIVGLVFGIILGRRAMKKRDI